MIEARRLAAQLGVTPSMSPELAERHLRTLLAGPDGMAAQAVLDARRARPTAPTAQQPPRDLSGAEAQGTRRSSAVAVERRSLPPLTEEELFAAYGILDRRDR